MTDTNAALSLTDAIANRRSVRSYTAEHLGSETIEALLAAAVRVPTAINEQKWAFVVVQGRPLLKHISEVARPLFASRVDRNQTEQSRQAVEMFDNPDFNIFYDADTLIIICAESKEPFVSADCWLAAENLMLAACAMGLGTCVIGSAVNGLNMPQLKAELAIPESMTVIAPIIVGIPAAEALVKKRNPPRILSWQGASTGQAAVLEPSVSDVRAPQLLTRSSRLMLQSPNLAHQQLSKQTTLPKMLPPMALTPRCPAVEIEGPGTFDRALHANIAHFKFGLSPASLALAYLDWALHLSVSPGKLTRLVDKGARKWARLGSYLPRACKETAQAPCIEPLTQDQRFNDPAWQKWPFNLYSQAFLLQQQWWHNATTGIGGVSAHHEEVVSFVARQLLDVVSPVNFIATNPLVLNATMQQNGQNLLRGFTNFMQDQQHALSGKPPLGTEAFRPGDEVASTPGKVVFRNQLIELIQYSCTTESVAAEPVLIVPAWIMKYYILDLSAQNSLVRYLVERGHTVFMISWHNPGSEDCDLGMHDYLRLGVLDALKAIQAIIPNTKVDTVGYCLGGTLLAIAAAYLAREGDTIVHSVTLLAAQTDFTEAGELTLFIDDSQLDFLEDIMWDQGYLDTKQMAGAFQLLQSNDLIWSQLVQQYLMGQRQPMIDLMAWNADGTRMPYRMHSEYLRRLFLDNALFEGRYQVDGKPIALGDISVPMFVVATERDHVAPWRSVYKVTLATDTDLAFVLTSGGHNAGIVSEPGHPRRHFRYGAASRQDKYVDPDTWFATISEQEGSWWPAWVDWLDRQASTQVAPPSLGAPQHGFPPLSDAPGAYVLEH